MGLRVFWMAVAGVLAAFGQCESPQQQLIQPAFHDLARIFARFETQVSTLASFQNHENLIVPNERVGTFALASTKTQIESSSPLQSEGVRTEPEYENILPLGYVPERFFAENPKLRFAFSTSDLALREIFVRNQEYKTASGVGVGSTFEGAKKAFPEGSENKRKSRTYWISQGITFIAEKGTVIEVVVFGKKNASP